MTGWKIAGIIATLAIVASIPLYLLKAASMTAPQTQMGPEAATFVGSRACMDCHKKEYDKWQNSHHDRAMEVAADDTVLGDFNHAVCDNFGTTSSFYRKDGRFFVHTRGPGGTMGDFEVTHTFGWYPLQQYLVPFPGGRLQCLPLAWDSREKQWYHLYPDEPLDPKDWLYWTNAGQNWNGMCAECHSTNLKKNYDVKTDSYATTWSDIDVGCEACHGPGSRHVEWAELPDMARPHVENYNLVVKTSGLTSRKLVELCAPCHSRRAILGDYTHAEPDLLDVMLPSLLNEGLYFADGQILDEVYVYGSFTQSRMYSRDVRCSDCHDVHSVKPLRDGNALCLQCHRAAEYDTKVHHFHKQKGEQGDPIKNAAGRILFEVGSGAECVQCHMPGRTYMGVDYRPDHSFRIPRPDLSLTLGVPNACTRCHVDKTVSWSEEYMTKWYGPGRRPHYGAIIDAGRKGVSQVRNELIRLAGDPLYPVIVRATALSLLRGYSAGKDIDRLFELSLMDDEALIRRAALEYLPISDPGRAVTLVAPMLYDSVKAVRIQGAARLAGAPSRQLDPVQFAVFQRVLEEYKAAMAYSGDFAFGRYNLGNLYVALNEPEKAIEHYRAAIKIDDLFYPARVNLAMLYNRLGNNDEAEALLREAVTVHPEVYDIAYSLGLLLVEKKQYTDAAVYLQKAAAGLPDRPRVHYNYGLLLQYLKRDSEAEKALLRAWTLEPDNSDYLYALTEFYLKRGRLSEAKRMAREMVTRHPQQTIGRELLEYIERKLERQAP